MIIDYTIHWHILHRLTLLIRWIFVIIIIIIIIIMIHYYHWSDGFHNYYYDITTAVELRIKS